MLLYSMNTLYNTCVAKSTQFGTSLAKLNNLGNSSQSL